MFKRLYQWIIAQARTPKAPWFLGTLSFLESSISPIPPDPLLIPMVIARPDRAWILAGLCTITSVVGGALGYWIGFALFEHVGLWILDLYNLVPAFHKLQDWFHQWGFWIIVVKGLTPIPYKVVTITSGATGLDFATFMLASLISRGGRFFIEAALLWRYGKKLDGFIQRHITILAVLFAIILIGGFIAIAYYA